MSNLMLKPNPMPSVMRVVGFSGGADSQATALWVRQRFPADEIVLLYSDPGGNDCPVTTEFVKQYSETIFPVTTVTPIVADMENVGTKPGRSMDRRRAFKDEDYLSFSDMAWIKGRFPSGTRQFCTTILKLNPQKRWLEENLLAKGIDFVRYIGVRRDESEKRKNTPDAGWDDFFDCEIVYPFAAESKLDVFAFLKLHGEEANPLYRLGFSRVGCAPCINANKEDVRQWAACFPQMIDKIREWEHRNERTFFAPCVPGKEINFVDEVVSWAKTSRGGKQFNLPMIEAEAALGTCSSKYGLCE